MAIEIVTKEDLQAFRVQLLNDLKQFLETTQPPVKHWLKNADVMKLLNVSANTVQRLRISGKLKSSKLGGVHYYRHEDIEEALRKGL